MPIYDPVKVSAAVKQVLSQSLGLSLAGIMKSFPAKAEGAVKEALEHEKRSGSVKHYMSNDAPPVPVYYLDGGA